MIADKSDISKTEFKISGMTCASCEERVIYVVNELNRILNLKASYENGNVIIELGLTKTNEIEKLVLKNSLIFI